jgi:regulator of sirC expression with transglutaminase-like and TPR domain
MNLNDTLAQLARQPRASFDVAEVALELARDEYADLDAEAYLAELAAMAHEARRYLRGTLEARVHGLCRYLFHDMGFRGSARDYYDPRNSYLNQVLERHTGIPISLSALVMSVGARAGLEVVGIGLPGHFVVKAVADGYEMIFDPFHGGRLLTPEACELLVEQVTGTPFRASPTQLSALPLASMVERMLNNLKAIYLGSEDFPRAVRVIERLRQLCPDDLGQRRDLGISLVRGGQPGKAIDHLAAYLASAPEDANREAVQRTLEQARSEVARWN